MDFRNIAYKLYLSLQGVLAIVSICFVLYHTYAMFVDVSNSNKAFDCLNKSFQGAVVLRREDWGGQIEGFVTEIGISKEVLAKREDFVSRQCGVRLNDYGYGSRIYLSGWVFDSSPTTYSKRMMFILYSILAPGILSLISFGLMKWTTWLFQKKNA